MIVLSCSKCGNDMKEIETGSVLCGNCGFLFENKNGILVDPDVAYESDKDFYDSIYEQEHGQQWFQGLNRASFAKRILERISLSYRRERFFKRNIKGADNIILDIACGAGRDYFKQFGQVIGVDVSRAPLEIAKHRYDTVIQSGVAQLPFAENMFDYVVSSDFFGHIPSDKKDVIIKEIYRVLKPGGKTLHIIETDSTNIWFRIAHRNPILFKKYFIEQIGGHIGLELPTKCVARWKADGFEIKSAKKIWGLIWPIQDYAGLFGNEYMETSPIVRVIVYISITAMKVKVIQVIINVILNPVNSFVETMTGLDHGQGLMLLCEKKRS